MGNILDGIGNLVDKAENGLAGAFQAGGKLANEAADLLKSHPQDKVGQAIGQGIHNGELLVGNIWQGMQNLGGAALHKAEDLGGAAVHGAQDLGSAAVHGAENLGSAVVHGAENLGSAVVHGAENLGSAVVHGAENVGGAIINHTRDVITSDISDISKHPGDALFLPLGGPILPVEPAGQLLRNGIHAAGDLGSAAVNGVEAAGSAIASGAQDLLHDITNPDWW
ncbi:MAG TPA: hypothetical protein V6C72_03110 [Chroococcales cyanobacterium]